MKNSEHSDSPETLGGPPTTQQRVPVPDDLPEHSLVSYNPNRTRYSSPSPITLAKADSGDSEDTLLPEQVPTQYLAGPEAEPAGPMRAEDRHRLVRLIGRGGCGEVWEAIQVQLDRPVAVKTLREDRFNANARDRTRAELVRNFREEALIAARLDHPNIVPVYDYGREADGTPQLTMKLVRGEPWDKMLKADREDLAFDDFLAKHLAILAAVANAVAFAHSRHIVHRDIKPSQVMVGEYGEVLLMDWGLAVVVGADRTMESMAAEQPAWFSLPTLLSASSPAGTPAYMAPEQTRATAEGVGPWTDIYLLGGCLYCVLAGRAPHEGIASHEAFLKAARGQVDDPRATVPEVPDDLAALTLNALAPEPADRLGSAEEFVRRLEDWISGASRRRESQRLTVQLLAELSAPRANYSAHVAFIDRIQQAAGLWPGNPDVPELRAHAIEDYAELALDKGDLLLALSQAELLPGSPRRTDLLRRIDVARVQRQRTRRTLRISVAAVVALVALVIVGGMVSLRRIDRERDVAISQKNIADAARDTAEQARQTAKSEQLYAQTRYATSLVDAGRLDMARAVLWSIPEAARDWEWAYLLDRAHQSIAEYPFAVTETSAGGSYFYCDAGDGTLQVRDTMAGALVAQLDCGTTGTQILPPPQDTHVDVLAGDRILRFAPPQWERRELLRVASAPARFMRSTEGSRFIAGLRDGTATVYDAETGAALYATPALPGEVTGIDADEISDTLLVAYRDCFRVHRLSDGKLEHTIPAFRDRADSPGITDRGHAIAFADGRDSYVVSLATRRIQSLWLVGPRIFTNPQSWQYVHMPRVITAGSAMLRAHVPVAFSPDASARFVRSNQIVYWGGPNGEAGLMDVNEGRVLTELSGFPGEVLAMWAVKGKAANGVRRLYTTTSDGTTQAWLSTRHRTLAELPGQWGSFRREGRHAVSIGEFDARITDLDTGVTARRSGSMFRIYRGIQILEERDRILTFGYGVNTDHQFGWEVRRFSDGEVLRYVKLGKENDRLPYLWSQTLDGAQVAVFWDQGEPGAILDGEDGSLIAPVPANGGAIVTALHVTKETIVTGDSNGLLVEIRLADGKELRRVETGARVWALKADKTGETLYASGDDRRWRAYSWTSGTEPSLLREVPSGDEPAVLLDYSSEGARRILALTGDNEVAIWDDATGKEVVRFPIDAQLFRLALNAEGTRIFGTGQRGLSVWDMQGREVARVPDVIDFSLESRRLLLRTTTEAIGKDIVVELPPYRAQDLPGTDAMTFEERFGLWRRAQHRNLLERETLARAPAAIAIARGSIKGTVGESRGRLLGDIDRISSELKGAVGPESAAAIELFRKSGMLATMDPAHDRFYFAYGLWVDQDWTENPDMLELYAALAPYTEARAIRLADSRGPVPADSRTWLNSEAALCLEAVGRMDLARPFLLRAAAAENGNDYRLGRWDERVRERLLEGTPVPVAPPELRTASQWRDENEVLARDRTLDPAAMPLESFAAETDALASEYEARFVAWLDSVAPRPDYAAALEEVGARFPPPPPADMPMAEFMGDVLDRLEREQLRGMTPDEARADIRRRFEESVSGIEAEIREIIEERARAGS